jgi:hypothetical protein
VDELIDRSGPVQIAANNPAPQPAAPAPAPSGGLTPNPPASQQQNPNAVTNPKFGPELGTAAGSVRGCVAGDTSAAGTVVDGYRKQIVAGPFGIGSQCSWVPAK